MVVQFTEEEIEQMGNLAKTPYWPEISLNFQIAEDKVAHLNPFGGSGKYAVSIYKTTEGKPMEFEDVGSKLKIYTLEEAGKAIDEYLKKNK